MNRGKARQGRKKREKERKREKASTYHVNNGAGHHDVGGDLLYGWVVKVMRVMGVGWWLVMAEAAGAARRKSVASELSQTTLVLARHGRQCRVPVELNGVVSLIDVSI